MSPSSVPALALKMYQDHPGSLRTPGFKMHYILAHWIVIATAFYQSFGLEAGPNVCAKQETYVTTVRISYNKPYQVRYYKWCPSYPFRCSRYRIAYTTGYKTEPKVNTRTVNACCQGFVLTSDESKCIRLIGHSPQVMEVGSSLSVGVVGGAVLAFISLLLIILVVIYYRRRVRRLKDELAYVTYAVDPNASSDRHHFDNPAYAYEGVPVGAAGIPLNNTGTNHIDNDLGMKSNLAKAKLGACGGYGNEKCLKSKTDSLCNTNIYHSIEDNTNIYHSIEDLKPSSSKKESFYDEVKDRSCDDRSHFDNHAYGNQGVPVGAAGTSLNNTGYEHIDNDLGVKSNLAKAKLGDEDSEIYIEKGACAGYGEENFLKSKADHLYNPNIYHSIEDLKPSSSKKESFYDEFKNRSCDGKASVSTHSNVYDHLQYNRPANDIKPQYHGMDEILKKGQQDESKDL